MAGFITEIGKEEEDEDEEENEEEEETDTHHLFVGGACSIPLDPEMRRIEELVIHLFLSDCATGAVSSAARSSRTVRLFFKKILLD